MKAPFCIVSAFRRIARFVANQFVRVKMPFSRLHKTTFRREPVHSNSFTSYKHRLVNSPHFLDVALIFCLLSGAFVRVSGQFPVNWVVI